MSLSLSESSSSNACVDGTLVSSFMLLAEASDQAILAVNDQMMLCNSAAREFLAPEDQQILQNWAKSTLQGSSVSRGTIRLPSGTSVRASCRPVHPEHPNSGTVIQIMHSAPSIENTERAKTAIPGSSRVAAALRSRFEQAASRQGNIICAGEPGTGKVFVATELLTVKGIKPVIVDPSTSNQWFARFVETLRRNENIVFPHIDRLTTDDADALVAAITKYGGGEVRIAATTQGAISLIHPQLAREFDTRLWLPPLRDRLEDIPEIITRFRSPLRVSQNPLRLDYEALRLVWSYEWPHNIAELESVVCEAASRSIGPYIQESSLQIGPDSRSKGPVMRQSAMDAAQRRTVIDALVRCGGNKKAAAAMLGIARSTLYRKIRSFGIENITVGV